MKNIAIVVLLTGRFETPQKWSLEIPAMLPEQAAELVFHLSNCPSHSPSELEILKAHPRHGLRSVSVGDVIIIQDHEKPEHRHILTVAPMGFASH